MTQCSSLADILHAYYIEKHSQPAIARLFGLAKSTEIFRLFGEYQHKNPCSHCGTPLTSNYANRTNSTERFKEVGYGRKEIPLSKRVLLTQETYKVYLPRCVKCGHYPDAMCDCLECSAIRDVNRNLLITAYRETLVCEKPPIDLDLLDAKHLLFIACFHDTNRDKTNARSSASKQITSADIFNFSTSMKLENLVNAGLLNVDTSCIEHCIEMTSPTTHVFHSDKLKYIFLGADDPSWIQHVKRQSRSLLEDSNSRDDVLRLWGELATNEAKNYYGKMSALHSIPFKDCPETISNIKRGVIEFGLFKTVAAITWCVHKAANQLREENIHPSHAANVAAKLFRWWLEKDRNWNPAARDSRRFPEPKLVSIFIEFFLPFTTDYGRVPLRELANRSETEEFA